MLLGLCQLYEKFLTSLIIAMRFSVNPEALKNKIITNGFHFLEMTKKCEVSGDLSFFRFQPFLFREFQQGCYKY